MSAETGSALSADELLQISGKVIESEQYVCTFRASGYAFPYSCQHTDNDLVVNYRLEDEYVLYEMYSTFMWDARNAVERFDSGANALQARFLEENLRVTQIDH
ncbi:MAG: hypothetical protein OXI86_11910 [Candidatus Poribacteria bacterium]|nr:hypothetical protein [Candidatus Poribacteria bacterium]